MENYGESQGEPTMPFSKERESVAATWEHTRQHEAGSTPMRKHTFSFTKVIFIFSLVFFFATILIAGFFIFGGRNIVSSDNIVFEIESPVAVAAGEELALNFSMINRNTVALESVDFEISFPEGSRNAEDLSVPVDRYRESFGTIAVNEKVDRNISVVLFGEENEKKEIRFFLEYRVEGSNAILQKTVPYEVTISSAPVILRIDSFKEISSGQQFKTTVEVVSNTSEVVEDLLLVADFPEGFSVISTDIDPSYGDDTWVIGDLPSKAKYTITILGTLNGHQADERTVRFVVGVVNSRNPQRIGTPLLSGSHRVTVTEPFISVDFALNGSQNSPFVTQNGKTIRADISWVNNLPTKVINAEVEVSLRGVVLDRRSITVPEGFYDSSKGVVQWNKDTLPSLGELSPGDFGRVSFTFNTIDFSRASLDIFRDPEIVLDLTVKGKRVSDSEVPEEIVFTAVRKARIATDLAVVPQALFSVGPFSNTGLLPPHAEQETTYTIIWTVTNTLNEVKNAEVSATLPSYVRWTGNVSPGSENIIFNPSGGQVVWRIGDLSRGQGIVGAPREVAFQVALKPSLSQIGSRPVLIGDVVVRGRDAFTEISVESRRSALTTFLLNDPGFLSGNDIVTQ